MKRPRRVALLVASLLLLVTSSASAQKKKKGKKKGPTPTTQTAPVKKDASGAIDLDAPKAAPVEGKPVEPAATGETEKKEEAKSDEGSDVEDGDKKDDDGKKLAIGGYLAMSVPFAGYAYTSGVGFGPMAEAEYKLSPAFRVSGRLGFEYHLDAESDFTLVRDAAGKVTREYGAGPNKSVSRAHVLPLVVGARIFPVEKVPFYATVEAGLFMRFVSEEVTIPTTPVPQEQSTTKFNFGAGIGAGYLIGPLDLRATAHTHDVSTFGGRLALGLSVGYRFLSL